MKAKIQQSKIHFANLALFSGRQMHCTNAYIFLVALTKRRMQKHFVSALRLSVWQWIDNPLYDPLH